MKQTHLLINFWNKCSNILQRQQSSWVNSRLQVSITYRLTVQIPFKTRRHVEKIEDECHHTTTHEHRYCPKNPDEERERQVKCSQSKRPEEAASVEVRSNVLNGILSIPESCCGHSTLWTVRCTERPRESRSKRTSQKRQPIVLSHTPTLQKRLIHC